MLVNPPAEPSEASLAGSVRTRPSTAIAPPEPGLTPAGMLARAVALRPLLTSRQAACEAEGRVSDEINAELVKAGLYRIVQPRATSIITL